MIQDFERTTTERLLLRRIQESDLDAVFTLHGDPETNRFNPSGPLRSMDAARELLNLENVPSLRVAERLGMRRDRIIDYEGIASAVYLSA